MSDSTLRLARGIIEGTIYRCKDTQNPGIRENWVSKDVYSFDLGALLHRGIYSGKVWLHKRKRPTTDRGYANVNSSKLVHKTFDELMSEGWTDKATYWGAYITEEV